MDAVGAVGGAGADFVQKDDIALPLLDPHRVAGEGGELGGERGQSAAAAIMREIEKLALARAARTSAERRDPV